MILTAFRSILALQVLPLRLLAPSGHNQINAAVLKSELDREAPVRACPENYGIEFPSLGVSRKPSCRKACSVTPNQASIVSPAFLEEIRDL